MRGGGERESMDICDGDGSHVPSPSTRDLFDGEKGLLIPSEAAPLPLRHGLGNRGSIFTMLGRFGERAGGDACPASAPPDPPSVSLKPLGSILRAKFTADSESLESMVEDREAGEEVRRASAHAGRP